MKTNEISSLLSQLRALSAETQSPIGLTPGSATDRPDFGDLLRRSVDSVNARQLEASRATEAFERGDPGVDVAGVMIAVQKSSIAFQALTQVRNRLVSAYQDIMNMPI